MNTLNIILWIFIIFVSILLNLNAFIYLIPAIIIEFLIFNF